VRFFPLPLDEAHPLDHVLDEIFGSLVEGVASKVCNLSAYEV
jgi:hypothetical protein